MKNMVRILKPFLKMKPVNNIFFIPIGDLLNKSIADYVLVYSPLAESMVILEKDVAEKLHKCLDSHNGECTNVEMSEIIESLNDYESIETRSDQIRSCKDFVTLYVLPNYACNFSCSYCFAAQGRDKQRLETSKLLSMIDWMLDVNRTSERRIYITFLGGGEPILSFDVMSRGVEYGNQLANERGFNIVWNVVTNGSLITDEMLDFFKRENVIVRYSFEVIPEIQELQRGNFDKVDSSIKLACSKGIHPVIRAMITPVNVNRLTEMVRLIELNYSGVKLFKIDPITDASFGDNLLKMEEFYRLFNAEYLKAKKLGEKLGIEVQCVTERNLDSVISRFCAGEISLNGYGEITACHRVSSPKEKGYTDLRYGYVDTEGVHIDENKFLMITSDKVDTKSNCADCFLKYNCAGGCHAQNEQYTKDMQSIVCHYTRELSRKLLFDRVCLQLQEDAGMDIFQLIESKNSK